VLSPIGVSSSHLLLCLLENVDIPDGEKLISVNLPAITNKWKKAVGEWRASLTVLLLSGVAMTAGDGVKVAVDPDTQKQAEIVMDISHSLMFNTEEYMDQFSTVVKGGVERPRYTENSSKWKAMESACAAHYLGASINNKVKAVHHQHTDGVTV
jgi:hypothetical protein